MDKNEEREIEKLIPKSLLNFLVIAIVIWLSAKAVLAIIDLGETLHSNI